MAASACFPLIGAARAQLYNQELAFDIPAQPLAAALRTFGTTTGLEVFYDGSLSIGRRSTAVKGTFTPAHGLKMLLRGTGYVARETDIENAVTIVSLPPIAPLRASFAQFEPYFAALQTRLSEALCKSDRLVPGGQEITVRFWVDPTGVISNAELVDVSGSVDRSRTIASEVKGLQVGKSPPIGLPEPLTMVIYPPSDGETAGCHPSDSRHAGD